MITNLMSRISESSRLEVLKNRLPHTLAGSYIAWKNDRLVDICYGVGSTYRRWGSRAYCFIGNMVNRKEGTTMKGNVTVEALLSHSQSAKR